MMVGIDVMDIRNSKPNDLELLVDALHEVEVQAALNIAIAHRVHEGCVGGVSLIAYRSRTSGKFWAHKC